MLPSDAPANSERSRILFVPHELLISELGSSFRDRAALSVRGVETFAEALQVADAWAPQLVVLHCGTEAQAAHDFCRRIRASVDSAPLRLLMITDRVQGELHDAADFDCDAHLVSPVDTEQLLSTIAELLDLQRKSVDRVAVDVLVHTEGFADEGVSVDATLSTALTLSEEVMLVEASRQLTIGGRGRLQFFLPGRPERIALDARVRVAVDEIRLLYVVEFVDLAPQHRRLIRTYMDSQGEAA